MRKDFVMKRPGLISRQQLDDLSRQLGERVQLDGSMILPFVDFTDLLTALLEHVANGASQLMVGGHATPDVAIAADRAGLTLEEKLGPTPFIGMADDVTGAIRTGTELVYLACPNRATGAAYALKDLTQMAERLKDGTLIVDEKYFDFYGISARPLLEKHAHVLILRSMTAGFGIRSDESGYLIGSPGVIGGLKEQHQWSGLSTTLYKIIITTLANREAQERRLTTVHDESLRLTTKLTRLGVQNRLTATDFLLMRVADPTRVGNVLAKGGTPIENLDGYPGLQNYVRYVVQSPLSNDRLLRSFERMPSELYKMKDIDKRAVMFRRPAEKAHQSKSANRPTAGNRLEPANITEAEPVGIED